MIAKLKINKKSYVVLTILVGLFIFLLFMANINMIHADVGNNNRYGGGSGGSSSDGGFGMFLLLFNLFGPVGSIGAIFVVGIIFFILKSQGKINIGNKSSQFDKPFQGNIEYDVVQQIQLEDPAFSADAFKQFASECFVTLQSAWTARDWASIRPFESEPLFNMHNRQLEEYIRNGTINVVEKLNVQSTSIISFAQQGDKDVVSVQLKAVMRDYIIDEKTKVVMEGDRMKDFYTTYRLEFIRTHGVKTVVGKHMSTTNCPNCGAPTAITSSGRCEYCDSIITTGDYSWVLNELTTM